MHMLEDIPEAFPLRKLLNDSAFGFMIKDAANQEIGKHMKTIRESLGFARILELLQILKLFASSPQTEQLTLTKSEPLDRFQRKNLNKVFDYVMANYNEKITLEEISSLVYMTPNAFCRFFKKHTQKSFSSFLIEVRVNKACKVLQDSSSSVSDSCYSSGYNNISNFHRHFRRVVGMTPNEYKKQLIHSTV
jgi:AraC-like DNA-binding protein